MEQTSILKKYDEEIEGVEKAKFELGLCYSLLQPVLNHKVYLTSPEPLRFLPEPSFIH